MLFPIFVYRAMRFWLFIAILTLSIVSRADHILGGEVTYSHLGDMKYDVHVTIYRDCNGSKLGGTGGGPSNSSHNDLTSAYLRVAEGNACSQSARNIKAIPLSKLGYDNITAVCAGVSTICDPNPSLSYGIEAHHYQGSLDFADLMEFKGCSFEITISLSDRSNDLTTTVSGSNFFNYAYIDPWGIQTSSPKFKRYPQFVYEQNKPIFTNYGLEGIDRDDSVSIFFDAPLQTRSSALIYKDGFDEKNFITPYCPSGDCVPLPNKDIPEGLYLSETGTLVVTPTDLGEMTTQVLVVELWKKSNGSYVLSSVVRRDVVMQVILAKDYSNPMIDVSETYHFCVGEKMSIPIGSRRLEKNPTPNDSIYLQVSGSDLFKDSTYFPSGSSYQQIELTSDTITSDMVGDIYLEVIAFDNNCPIPGRSQKVIHVQVHSLPDFDLEVDDQFCGTTLIKINSDKHSAFDLNILKNGSSLLSRHVSSSLKFVDLDSSTMEYRAMVQDQYGCSAEQVVVMDHLGAKGVSPAQISGDFEVCEGDTIRLELSHDQYAIESVNWWKTGPRQIGSGTVLETLEEGNILVKYQLKHDGIFCNLTTNAITKINPLPVVLFDDLSDQCAKSQDMDLSKLNARPENGTWSSIASEIKGGRLILSKLENYGLSYDLTYTAMDELTGCTNKKTSYFNVIPAPELELTDVSLCGLYDFRLVNCISKPSYYEPENIKWTVPGYENYLSGEHPSTALDIPTLGIGEYTIIGENSYSNGCAISDTAVLVVDENLKLTYNGNHVMCSGDDPIDLNKFFAINAPGVGWYSSDVQDGQLNGAKFVPSSCGFYTFEYVYDAFGCYDRIEIELEVECPPDITIEAADNVCVNSRPIILEGSVIGDWAGESILNGVFYPNIGEGIYPISLTHESVNGCIYEATDQIQVHQSVSLQIMDVPDKLCEGDEFEIEIRKDDHSSLNVGVCDEDRLEVRPGVLNYNPGLCDLQGELVTMTVTAQSFQTCPEVTKIIEVPYYKLPKIEEPNPVNGCYPLTIDQELSLVSNIEVVVNYSIISVGESHSSEGTSIYYEDLSSGSYDLSISLNDANGCTNEYVFESIYKIHHKPNADFEILEGNVVPVGKQELTTINHSLVEQGEMSYLWWVSKGIDRDLVSELSDPVIILPDDTGTFDITLVATTNIGCVDSSSRLVTVIPEIIIYIPNAFTPDGEGPQRNETFNVEATNVKEFTIAIYNRWGERVYQSNNIDEGWDGTFLGDMCPPGVYFYTIDLMNGSGKTYSYEGTLNLLR